MRGQFTAIWAKGKHRGRALKPYRHITFTKKEIKKLRKVLPRKVLKWVGFHKFKV